MKFAENLLLTEADIALIAEATWTIAMRNVIRPARMDLGMIAKNVSAAIIICSMCTAKVKDDYGL